MDFAPLTPPPGTTPSSDMALALTSTPNPYSARKAIHQFHMDAPSESVGLFGSKSLNDNDSKSRGIYNNQPSPPRSEGSNSSADTLDSDSSSSISDDKNDEDDRKLDDDDLSDDDEPVDCANCNQGFASLQSYMDHKCAAKMSGKDPEAQEKGNTNFDGELSEGESFDGKIVYNSDGSAYIIEGADSDLSDLESVIDIPDQDQIIVDKKGSNVVSQVPAFPQIANAFFVSRNPNFNGTYSIPSSQVAPSQAPMMFSYRVYDVRTGKSQGGSGQSGDHNDTTSDSFLLNVPTKPILMCFICKLSFGFTKSFMAHAASEHSMRLNEDERRIMSKKNASAIIQCVGKEKEPLMSFLEPKPMIPSSNTSSSKSSASLHSFHLPNSDSLASHGVIRDSTSVSFVHSKPKSSSPYLNSTSTTRGMTDDHSKTSEDRYSNAHSFGHGANSLKVSEKSNGSLSEDLNDCQDDRINDDSSYSYISGTKPPKSSPGSPYTYKLPRSDINSSTTSSASHAAVPSSSLHVPPSSPHTSLMTPSSPHNSMVFLGMCDEHPQGRAQGVECPKCDMVLGSSQSLGGHMTMMHSRNSCKTLKCPKCNWHYKYQETLEIHMKEKHPENDQQCVYCISNQPHPRLARGESYSCGYKPYRCEVCNYSTTTKGNLSIHMQSDKHLNNVQELANGGTEMKMAPQQTQPPPPSSQPVQAVNDTMSQMKKNKPKPTWRCDVCNYETNVARNLRIHMTSEKHTHNMMVLQQNMKHMQRDMQIQHMNQLMLLQNDPSYLPAMTSPVANNRSFPYDQSMLMAGIQAGFGDIPVDLRKENGGIGMAFDPQMPDSTYMFQCCVCNLHSTDSLESLHNHLQLDRTKLREQENIHVSQGTYMCNLCQYKTQLKANFQLHCKTDKHLQRLQLVNHIKEGGPTNEWRLKYLNVSNPVQVRCNACDYYTNSIHKLQIHTGNPRHESNAQLFCHLQLGEKKLGAACKKYYYCSLCKFATRAKLNLIQHVRSMKHMHSEGRKQIQMKEQNITEIDPGEIFQVRKYTEEEETTIKFDEEGELDFFMSCNPIG
ncbi:hypothetical protein FSP39_017455 [Pinctada imbricata]|uniref:C2H2-type domain-containing protein n=1 Tax=Pinctada imbricata TaxID=66713 RepID=A0AA89BPI4_PINIB|nr:hypothetical protein FSP39_017455 [Pinctada imbricata]